VQEVIEAIRRLSPNTKIILGGVYATLCPSHARALAIDLVVVSSELGLLWQLLCMMPDETQLPLWDFHRKLQAGVLKLADGCPFRCTYCSVPQVYPKFHAPPLEHSLAELGFLRLGVEHVAFYDDALLYRPERILGPFLMEVLQRNIQVQFHTPNAMNARFIGKEMARLLIAGGFKNIYLGIESNAFAWQKKTGGKVYSEELARAVENLLLAGADPCRRHAYLIVGPPSDNEQAVEDSMLFAHRLGINVVLSEFSPIPGTPDGEQCRRWIDLDEPLRHNKTAFVIDRLGDSEINRLKTMAGRLNRQLTLEASAPPLQRAMDLVHSERR
jgi:radical SAM family protein